MGGWKNGQVAELWGGAPQGDKGTKGRREGLDALSEVVRFSLLMNIWRRDMCCCTSADRSFDDSSSAALKDLLWSSTAMFAASMALSSCSSWKLASFVRPLLPLPLMLLLLAFRTGFFFATPPFSASEPFFSLPAPRPPRELKDDFLVAPGPRPEEEEEAGPDDDIEPFRASPPDPEEDPAAFTFDVSEARPLLFPVAPSFPSFPPFPPLPF